MISICLITQHHSNRIYTIQRCFLFGIGLFGSQVISSQMTLKHGEDYGTLRTISHHYFNKIARIETNTFDCDWNCDGNNAKWKMRGSQSSKTRKKIHKALMPRNNGEYCSWNGIETIDWKRFFVVTSLLKKENIFWYRVVWYRTVNKCIDLHERKNKQGN